MMPGYTSMQDIIGQALTYEQDRLATILSRYLSRSDKQRLNELLEDSAGLYEITQLKREPKDFSAGEIKREIQRGDQIRDLYLLADKLLPDLDISNESIKYYASLVNYYSVYKLKRFDELTTYLYLLCFVYHRYQTLHDNLIQCFVHHVRQFREAAKEEGKEQVYQQHREGNEKLDKAAQILKLFTDSSIARQTPFHQVQSRAFGILDGPQIDLVADHIATDVKVDETAFQWGYIDDVASQFKRHLRPINASVDWAASASHSAVIEATDFLKNAFSRGRSLGQYATKSLPQHFIPDASKRYLYEVDASRQRRVRPDRYEFSVYRSLRNGVEAGDIFCRHSVRFRSFEDDLVDHDKWQDKEQLIEQTGLKSLKQPIREHLDELEDYLERRLIEVNTRIASGENEHFEMKRRGAKNRWTLKYPRNTEPVNAPFFDALKQVDIGAVLHFVQQHCPFMDVFDHVLGRYTRQQIDPHILTACLMAWGTNMGLGRMADACDIDYQELVSASDNFIRLETLKEANDRVSNAIAALPIFEHYDIGDAVHSSSDGQKFETRINTINARYSPKYFGLKKGVVSYSLVANHVPVNAKIIGANDHESHYVFDILFNNTSDIQPEVHSTDTHGTNAVNFAILHLFGYQFAPRYRDFYDTVRTSLYGFQHPSQYDDEMILKPRRKLNPELIVEEWDNIQRIMVSLALKTTTQDIIVRKLSAFALKNKTRRALWEYDHILRSLYLLDYIDSASLRRNVQRALNRGENYHQLRRAVSYANFGKLRFKTEHDQQIWGECARLITNCIIYYNTRLLSDLLDYKESAGDLEGAERLKQVSPVAWQHINFFGRYEFRRAPEAINLREIVRELGQLPVRLASGV
ncbi:MAG: transposase [Candidatus Entotheonella factor]|uniref:Transposase n=1 Tax=Entotheonella factor TaxID=1429438 RepID=W4LCG4_ENTF1|nr:MAG: transposase [Candidatus Entotheonella factor]